MHSTRYSYLPFRKKGAWALSILLLLALSAAMVFFWRSSLTSDTLLFAIFLGAGILCLLPVPMLAYRLLALFRAYYLLDRNYLTIHWGLRTELIPLREVHWMRPVDSILPMLKKPKLALPGAYLGFRTIESVGKVEYLADDLEGAILIATGKSAYVISPADAAGFLASFYRFVELGNIDTVAATSIQPAFVLGRLMDDRVIRWLVLAGFVINAAAFVLTLPVITSRSQVTFGYSLAGTVSVVPSVQLLLLPVLSAIIFLVDIISGAFFFRNDGQRFLTYLVIGSAGVTGLLILATIVRVMVSA